MVRVSECITHYYTHDCGWYKTEESWHPAENCEDQCSHYTCHKGILGEFGGEFCRTCESLLCGRNGLLRLCQDHLWLCSVRGGEG